MATTTIEKDRFGSKPGTQAAAINVCLDGTPKTAEQVAKECGLSVGRVRSHLKYLAENKHVEPLYRVNGK